MFSWVASFPCRRSSFTYSIRAGCIRSNGLSEPKYTIHNSALKRLKHNRFVLTNYFTDGVPKKSLLLLPTLQHCMQFLTTCCLALQAILAWTLDWSLRPLANCSIYSKYCWNHLFKRKSQSMAYNGTTWKLDTKFAHRFVLSRLLLKLLSVRRYFRDLPAIVKVYRHFWGSSRS